METLIIITEGSEDATPTFVSSPDTLYATIGMEMVMLFDVIIDDNTTDNLTVVSLTMLPAGVMVEPVMMSGNDTGVCCVGLVCDHVNSTLHRLGVHKSNKQKYHVTESIALTKQIANFRMPDNHFYLTHL